MQQNRLSGFVILILATAIFAAGYWVGQVTDPPLPLTSRAAGTPEEVRAVFEPFWEVWQLIHQEYYDQPVDNQALVEGAINGMLATLEDPNTAYLPPEEQASLVESLSGEFEGIGAEVEAVDGAITIVAPFEGSPADEAGLRSGDIIRAADGVQLTGMDVFEAAQRVRGPAGTDVELQIERNGDLLTVVVTRGVIKVPSVRGEIIEGDLAYVRLSRFGETTDEELADLLAALMAQDPSGMILDLRRNPGGVLDTAVAVADQFLPRGPIVIEAFGNGREVNFDATDRGLAQEIPLAVLVDEGSASASEVVAGALRDRERATIIGQTTFGKGTVQTWRVLSNNGGVRLTVARWLTPDRISVHEAGLEPDLVVALPQSVEESSPSDTQLEAAVRFLLGQALD